MRDKLFAVMLGGAAVFAAAPSAKAYPIDCAILLCLAGGFPASAECGAAKAEVIRRITPWPIEPPLQIWRCPMGGGNVSLPGVGADGLTPEVRKYRDEIEVWELSKRTSGGSGGRDLYVTIVRNYYNSAGDFTREPVSLSSVPEWVHTSLSQLGPFMSLTSEFGGFRGIMMRMMDYKGDYTTEWVEY